MVFRKIYEKPIRETENDFSEVFQIIKNDSKEKTYSSLRFKVLSY